MLSSTIRGAAYRFYETGIRRRKTFGYLKQYDKNQWLSADELRCLQLVKLKRLLQHCQEHVPFYRAHWKRAGVCAPDLREPEDLRHFPVVTKSLLREHYADAVARPWRGRALKKATGGSTGEPFAFEYTRESYERRTAVMIRGYRWAGWQPGVKRMDVWGTDGQSRVGIKQIKAKLHDMILGRRVVSCFEMTQDNLSTFIDKINAFRPRVVVGYTSALVELASWVTTHGGLTIVPRAVISGAEMLRREQRDAIQNSFGADVFDTYGCREFMLIGSECEQHNGYHLSADHLIVELTDDDGQRLQSGAGQVTITDLHNDAMPFVRYVNGDLARSMDGALPCPCGRSLPRLGPVEGRQLDVLTTPDGRIIPGEFFPHLMKDFRTIRYFQVRQTQEDKLTILLVGRSGMPADQFDQLRESIARQTGPSLHVDFQWVAEIPLTQSGKRRVTVREIERCDA